MLLRQNSSKLVICLADMVVLRCKSLSSSSFLCMMAIAGFVDTDVNNASISYETMHSSFCDLMSLMLCMKSLVFFTLYDIFPTRGLKILDSSLAVSYETDPMLDTIGLNGIPILCILGKP